MMKKISPRFSAFVYLLFFAVNFLFFPLKPLLINASSEGYSVDGVNAAWLGSNQEITLTGNNQLRILSAPTKIILIKFNHRMALL